MKLNISKRLWIKMFSQWLGLKALKIEKIVADSDYQRSFIGRTGGTRTPTAWAKVLL